MELPEVFSKHVVNCLPIDNEKAGLTEDQDKIECFREEILDQAKKLPHIKAKIPLQWHRVEKEITKVRERNKYLKKTVFCTEIASRFCDRDFDELLYFLQARGSIIFHKCVGNEDDLVVLDPKWFIGVLYTIVNVKPCCKGENPLIAKEREVLEKKGILGNNLLNYTLKRLGLDDIKDSLMSLLERFNLIYRWPAEKQLILVPCMMKTEAEKVDAGDKTSVFLTFDRMNYVPAGLFCLLVVQFAGWLSDPQRFHEYELFANKSKFALDRYHFLHLVSYKTVIKLFIEGKYGLSEHFVTGDSSRPSKHFVDVLRHLTKFLDTLKRKCNWLHSLTYKVCARCTDCLGEQTERCKRHNTKECQHPDCTTLYIDLKPPSKPCCTKHERPLPQIFQPWIEALTQLKKEEEEKNLGSDNVYKMTAEPRGVALIINNKTFNPLLGLETREGSEKDVAELDQLLKSLKFEVQIKQNLGKKQLFSTLKEVANANHSEYDCFVLCLMSHGKKGGHILCSGGGSIHIDEVLEMFYSVNCKTLEGKPKVVFVQACRGNKEDSVEDGPKRKRFKQFTEPPATAICSDGQFDERAHIYADFLIANSTVDDYVSYRRPSQGSYFVLSLVKVFREKWQDEHLVELMTSVNNDISQLTMEPRKDVEAKAICECKFTLTKKLFF